jgi:hypothetical protein
MLRGPFLVLPFDLVGVLELPSDAKFAVDKRHAGELVDMNAYLEESMAREKHVKLRSQATRRGCILGIWGRHRGIQGGEMRKGAKDQILCRPMAADRRMDFPIWKSKLRASSSSLLRHAVANIPDNWRSSLTLIWSA